MTGKFSSRFRLGKSALWWLGISVSIGLIGWSKSINLLLILGFVLLGLMVCQGWIARRIVRGIRLNPGEGGTGFAGEPLAVSFELINSSSKHCTLRIETPLGLRWLFPELPPRTSIRASHDATFPTRGCHRLGKFAAISAYPFGIVEYKKELAIVPELFVLPALGAIHEARLRKWLRSAGFGENRKMRTSIQHWPTEGDVRGIRPYRTGDNPRDIHWKTTARRGALHVREYDTSTPRDMVLIVEAFAPSNDLPYEPLEWALSLAATLAWEWSRCEAPARVRLLVLGHAGGIVRVVPGNRSSLRILADIAGETESIGFDLAKHAVAFRHAHRVFVSSRSGSRWPGEFAAAGFPVLAVSPDYAPHWYRPPRENPADHTPPAVESKHLRAG